MILRRAFRLKNWQKLFRIPDIPCIRGVGTAEEVAVPGTIAETEETGVEVTGVTEITGVTEMAGVTADGTALFQFCGALATFAVAPSP